MTRSERLHRVVAKVWPEAAEQHAKDGSWPNRIENPRKNPETNEVDEHSGGPYVITTTKDNGRRIQVHSEDGDMVGARGATLEEALTALEKKLGLGEGA